MRMSHIGICVSDWRRSLRFYSEALGFRYASELSVKGEPTDTLLRLRDVDLRAIYLERDGVCIELLHYASPGHRGDATPRPMNQLGLTHLSLRVDDLEGTLGELEEAGATVLRDTRIANHRARTQVVFVTDPDGTLIELVERPGD
jgi:catechol 2,3-dioxygenase-like lactoylglutathione lyase family enzyme